MVPGQNRIHVFAPGSYRGRCRGGKPATTIGSVGTELVDSLQCVMEQGLSIGPADKDRAVLYARNREDAEGSERADFGDMGGRYQAAREMAFGGADHLCKYSAGTIFN